MPFITINEFKDLLKDTPETEIVTEYIFAGAPYAFRQNPLLMNVVVRHLTSRLPITAEDITIVGSAKLGFSLNPDAYFNQFSEESDIDIVVVNETLFDEVWSILLKWHYPRRYTGLENIANSRWAGSRQKDIYWGWLSPDEIRYEGLFFPNALKPLRDLSTAWFNAFRAFSHYPELAGRVMRGRLYRTWNHALLYHAEGLRQLKEFLREIEE